MEHAEGDSGGRDGLPGRQEAGSLGAIVDALPVPAILVEGSSAASAVVAAANPVSIEVLGAGTAPGTPLREMAERLGVYPPDRQAQIRWADLPAVRAIDAGETIRLSEIHLLRPDRRWRVLLVNAAPLRRNDQVSGALIVFQDVTESRQAARRLAAEYAVSRTLSDATDLVQAGPEILQSVGMELGWSFGALWVPNDGGEALRCAATWQAPGLASAGFAAATRQAVLPLGEGLPGRVWVSGEPVWIADVARDAHFPRRLAAALDGVCTGLGFPIVVAGKVVGVFEMFSREVQEPDPGLVRAMTAVGSQVGQFIERKQAEASLRQAREQAEEAYRRERRIAVQFQRAVLPRRELHVRGYAVAVAYRPALREADVGGDFYNLFRIDAQRVGVVVGDVGGKGLAAAVVAAWMQDAIVTLAVGEQALPDTVLRDIRRAILVFEEPERLATAFVGVLEWATGRLLYSSAGHEAALVWRSDTGRVDALEPDGPAIVSIPIGPPNRTQEATIGPGDILFLYSDGLPDARAGRGSPPLGRERVKELLAEHHGDEPAAIVGAMCAVATRHAQGRLPDDMALMAIRRLETETAPPSWVYVEHDDLAPCGTAGHAHTPGG